MNDLGATLRDYAKRFQRERGSSQPSEIRDAADETIQRLIAWSVGNADALTDRGPEGKDPAFGVAPAGGIATVWRVYPRQADGGKVTILSKAEHYLKPDERLRIVNVLEQLQPPTKIGDGQRLEIGLARIAPDVQWARFSSLLSAAVEVAKRHRA